ncbi:MAG: hypothetical protein NC187_05980 [Candidatus Amulumruptor caecigallinarius]|nr:hypothetical protein [Candidatus Amulumruptor caecigallinarius]MCM1397018.1 hypothetical protein [Candidatus Amulumruptor caecigallinarius]MCM1454045.1 hypothetical protein [bacterium]
MNLLKTIAAGLCILAATLQADGANAVKGLWTHTPVSRPSSVTQIAESPDALWYIGGGSLHRYDRATGDVAIYGIDRGLNTDYTRFIRYNADKGYLVAAMVDGLLNVIHDDGTVVPVNDVAKVRASRGFTINDVAFRDDDLYVAVDYGMAIVDPATGRLKQSFVYPSITAGNEGPNGGPSNIVILGDWIYACWNPYPYIYGAPLTADFSSPAAWSKFSGTAFYDAKVASTHRITGLLALDSSTIMVEHTKGNGVLATNYPVIWPDNATKTYTMSGKGTDAQRFQRAWMAGGSLYMMYKPSGENVINLYDYASPTAGVTATRQLFDVTNPKFTTVSTSPYASTVWIADENGLAGYEYAADGSRTMTVTPEQTAYAGAHTTVGNISMLRPTPDGTGLLITSRSDTNNYLQNAGKFYNPDVEPFYDIMAILYPGQYINANNVLLGVEPAFFVAGYVNLYKDGTFTDYSPKEAFTKQGNTDITNSNNIWPYTRIIYEVMNQQPIISPNAIAANPKSETPDIWVATVNEGLYRMRYDADGNLTQTIYSNRLNNVLSGGWYNQQKDVRFDDEGNLWIIGVDCWSSTGVNGPDRRRSLNMLPADKVASGNFTLDDWIDPAVQPSFSDWLVKLDAQLWFVNTDHGKYLAVNPQRGVGGMLVYKRNGTGGDTSTDQAWVIESLRTQFGELVSLEFTNALYSDSKGRLWIQTDRFFGYVNDFSRLADGDSVLDVVKVGEGSITDSGAPDMLTGEEIVALSEAPDGTIWAATQTSGLYQLSADGTKVLDHYDSSNSPLPSDMLGAVCVLADGTVHVGTRHGLYSLTPGKAAAAADLDNVTVTPSATPAAYTGHFTIANLTADAPVRISTLPDPTKGTVLFDGTAAGGALIWDGLSAADGSRPGPGTYYVHAGSPLRPVAKIVIID